MRLVTVWIAGLVLVVVAAPVAPAQSTVRAIGDWSMAPQSKDANGDGFIDGDGGVPSARPLGSQPSTQFIGAGNRIAQPSERLIGGSQSWYLNPRGFSVKLDACRSTGNEYRWVVHENSQPITSTPWRKLKKRSCTRSIRLPEGTYRLKLEVRSGPARTDLMWMDAEVRDYLFLVLGDSYASGEGNPRNVQAWLDDPDVPFYPYYDDDPCNRSTRSGPAQAALALENSSSKSSVTLFDVSCSGATVNAGILGPQQIAGQTESQIEQAKSLIGDRDIDVLVLSVGGNDIGFTSLIGACALNLDCPLARAAVPPLSRFDSVQQGVQTLTARLPDSYARIAQCLNGGSCQLADGTRTPSLKLAPDARVLPMTYPDITRASNGQPCRYLTLTQFDFSWARETILVPQAANPYRFITFGGSPRDLSTAAGTLNGHIIGTANLGWRPIVGIWGASGDSTTGHGVCAGPESWFFGITTLAGPFSSAAFHPNPGGQRFLARQIARALGVD